MGALGGLGLSLPVSFDVKGLGGDLSSRLTASPSLGGGVMTAASLSTSYLKLDRVLQFITGAEKQAREYKKGKTGYDIGLLMSLPVLREHTGRSSSILDIPQPLH